MASSSELIAALRELRGDPVVASVLRGEPDPATRSRLKTVVDLNPSAASGEIEPPRSHHVETQLYYRSRDADREAVGVENWLQHHREALSASESKRLENRLRAEHLFAASQLEIGQLKADHAESSARLFQQTEDLQKQRHRDAEEQEALDARQYAEKLQRTTDIELLSPLPMEPYAAENMSSAQRQPRAPSMDTSVQTPSFLAPRGAILYEPSAEPTLYTSGILPTSSLVMDTSQLGEIDEEKNYAEKARLVGSIASPQPRSGSANAIQATTSTRSPPGTSMMHLHQSTIASPKNGRSTYAKEASATELTALKEAVEQRDRTIRRLEKQLHEDHVYYETQLARAKQDLQQAELMADSRVTALRAQLDEALSRRRPGSSSIEYTAEEVQQKLLSVQQMYRANLEEIKAASSRALDAVQEATEARVIDVTTKAEKSIAEAREAFRRDRFDSLSKEKEQLLQVLTREMELALRESEISFRDSIHEAVSAKIRDEIQVVFRRHLKSDVLPTVQLKMVADVRSQVSASSLKELEGVCAEKILHLRSVVRDEVIALGPQIEKIFSQIADRHDHFMQTVDKSVLDVLSADVRQLHSAVRDVENETQLQESLEKQHRQKMLVYQRRIDELETNLDSERLFQHQVRANISKEEERRILAERMDEPIAAPVPATTSTSGAEQAADSRAPATSRGTSLPPWMRSGSGAK